MSKPDEVSAAAARRTGSDGKQGFLESPFSRPLCDLGLKLEGTPLGEIVRQFEEEVRQAGVTRLKPHCYLSTEWGVPFGTVSIGIPFYLATPELTRLHAERVGHIEGTHRSDILRYLRHEMGHVVNYAYRLYDLEDWVKLFGSMTQPYEEDYRPEPFSRRFVRHLPGWYAQKHPDEDWSETFAVWMTPNSNWREEYADWPEALAKLTYCDRLMGELSRCDPLVSVRESDEAVSDLAYSVDEFYRRMESPEESLPPGIDGSLRAIFDDLAEAWERDEANESLPASRLLKKLLPQLMAEVYRWTGHFPERTRLLVAHMADRADALQQVYKPAHEPQAAAAVTVLVTSLAMNFVLLGSYHPEPRKKAK